MRSSFVFFALALMLGTATPSATGDPAPSELVADAAVPAWQPLQAGASCTGEAGGNEVFLACPGSTAAQCCTLARNTFPGFTGICEGDAEILC